MCLIQAICNRIDRRNMEVDQDQPVVNVDHLRQKISSEYHFITSVLDRVPSLHWQVAENGGDDEISSRLETLGVRVASISSKTSRAQTLEELQERLQALKAKKKQGYRDIVSRRNLKTKLKKRKKADERNLKHKQKKLEKQSPKEMSTMSGSTDNGSDQRPSKPVFNSDGKMVFSKFDFSEIGSHKEDKKKKKELKDPRKILEKLKEKKDTLKKLKAEGQESKVLEIKQKEAWSNALKKAEGIKVKDDPELLKKALKREDARKKQSAKKWASREHGKKKAIKDKQAKREGNIQARKDLVKKQKRAKAIKKGRIVPGF